MKNRWQHQLDSMSLGATLAVAGSVVLWGVLSLSQWDHEVVALHSGVTTLIPTPRI